MRGPVRGCHLGGYGLGHGVHWLVIRNIRGRGLAQSNHGIWYDLGFVLYDYLVIPNSMGSAAIMVISLYLIGIARGLTPALYFEIICT